MEEVSLIEEAQRILYNPSCPINLRGEIYSVLGRMTPAELAEYITTGDDVSKDYVFSFLSEKPEIGRLVGRLFDEDC